MRFDADGNIYIRQSWLDDVQRCAESGRLSVMKPEWKGPSDATTLGTGAHAGIESYILHQDDQMAFDAIGHAIIAELSLPNVKWNKYDDEDELHRRATACFIAWRDEIWPTLPRPGSPEVGFCVHLFDLPDGRSVYIEGTIDYVPHEVNGLYDWKFPGREYRADEKQKYAIQPTIYGIAAVNRGLDSVTDFEFHWPLPFTYGIGVTQAAKAKPQTFTVYRTQAHADWAIERIKGWVDLALNFGMDRPWPRNDESFLCSAKWCSYWSICKGAHLTWQHDLMHKS